MKIFLVCSTSRSWMNTGYGAALLPGDANRLLVSFVEFAKDPSQQLAVTTMAPNYEPNVARERTALADANHLLAAE